MNNITNQVAFLRTSREFPEDLHQLAVECNKSYVDIANAVNARTIGIYPVNRSAITGNSFFLTNQRQQSLRQIYSFGAIAPGGELDIPTGITTGEVQFVRIYGTVTTNAPDFRPLPYIDPSNLAVGMTILVGTVAGKQQIRIVLGAAALPVTSGIAVIEWLSAI